MARILVIDDAGDVRRVVRRYLETASHEVVEAGDGRAGVKRYQETPADLVITDLFMPEQEGLETIRQLRRIAKDPRILVMTGIPPGGPFDFRAHAILLGAQRTLTKPFTREELLDTVQEMLRTERGAVQPALDSQLAIRRVAQLCLDGPSSRARSRGPNRRSSRGDHSRDAHTPGDLRAGRPT